MIFELISLNFSLIICRRTWDTENVVYWRWFRKRFCHNAPGIKPNGHISCCHSIQEPFRPKACHRRCFNRPQPESRNILWEISKLWYLFDYLSNIKHTFLTFITYIFHCIDLLKNNTKGVIFLLLILPFFFKTSYRKPLLNFRHFKC